MTEYCVRCGSPIKLAHRKWKPPIESKHLNGGIYLNRGKCSNPDCGTDYYLKDRSAYEQQGCIEVIYY